MTRAATTARLAPWATAIEGARTRYTLDIDLVGDGKREPLTHWTRHSDSLEWGYNGSGPADLAYSILMDVTGQPSLARSLYQGYKAAVIARLPEESWCITVESVCEWIQHETAELHDMHELDRSIDRMIAREAEAEPDYDDAA
jgi:hypothetical protein